MSHNQTIPASQSHNKTQELAFIGLMTAITCVLGPLSIPLPFSPVPISFTNLAIFLCAYLLGVRKSTISYLIYFLIGMVGLPVFSGFSGGIGKIVGPTGGYLIGFFFLAAIVGYFSEKGKGRPLWAVIGMVLGMAVCYAFGTIWLSYQLGISFLAGLSIGVIPYLLGDFIKIIFALVIGIPLRKAIGRLS